VSSYNEISKAKLNYDLLVQEILCFGRVNLNLIIGIVIGKNVNVRKRLSCYI
jgi:hypothetical protein